MLKRQIAGRTAVISGAGSGIGRAVAQRLSALGSPVALVDINPETLAETAALLPGPALPRVLDVTDRDGWARFAAEVHDWAPAPLGMVFTNAGVAAGGSVARGPIENHDWVLGINLGGVVNGVRAFLPLLLAQGSGVLVATSSVWGLVGARQQSAYAASKHAVRGYQESLRLELRGTGVGAVTVHPGGVRTNIVRNGRGESETGRSVEEVARTFDRIARTSPDRAAEVIVRGVERGRSRILVGPDAYVIDAVARLSPAHYADVFAGVERLLRLRGLDTD